MHFKQLVEVQAARSVLLRTTTKRRKEVRVDDFELLPAVGTVWSIPMCQKVDT